MITILAPAFYNSWDKVRYLKQSAERWDSPITFYGFGEPYKGWHDVQIDRLIEEIKKVDTKYILYTDASDVIVNGNMPIVEPCKDCGPDTMNPQTKWRCALKWSLRNQVCNDTNRSLFQVADEPLEIVGKRLYNPRTKTFPFLIHWAGGYTDPEVGKSQLIEPYWSQLLNSQ